MSLGSAGAPEWVTLAVLGRTRGNRGEITAIGFSKPERYAGLREVWLFGEGRRYEVESSWFHGEILIFKFRGVDSISDAEALAGAEVRVPLAQRVQLEPGEYFQSDLVGCTVVERGNGQPLGQVTAFEESGGAGTLVVGGGLMIPFARAICVEIDVEARRILVELPDGLKDINPA